MQNDGFSEVWGGVQKVYSEGRTWAKGNPFKASLAIVGTVALVAFAIAAFSRSSTPSSSHNSWSNFNPKPNRRHSPKKPEDPPSTSGTNSAEDKTKASTSTKTSSTKASSPLQRGRPSKHTTWPGRDSTLPTEPSIYRAYNRTDNSLDYIGKSVNPRRRLGEHFRAASNPIRPDTHVVDIIPAKPGITDSELREAEKMQIFKHQPRWNKTVGGNGR
ncbi:GIY-YIG nuclease family protein [Ferrimonas sp. SCSIO 43195]|uniref:GIY-YIG nuclease family protein n=1 Tax=Ferrimonas sp. SCSIO 43195 TaxID=2822844 RepID=UPI0035309520